jgi:hypothetical protein
MRGDRVLFLARWAADSLRKRDGAEYQRACVRRSRAASCWEFDWIRTEKFDVADQTGLAGKFDFTLRWTPDNAQGSDANTPPGLFTAIQEQIGLKLDAAKARVDVLVIDHVDYLSPNSIVFRASFDRYFHLMLQPMLGCWLGLTG